MRPARFILALMLATSVAQAQSWTNRYNGTANRTDSASDIALDGNGNVFVTGNSDTSGFNTNFSFVTIKYSNSGLPQWTNHYPARNPYYNPCSLVVDAVGNLCVAGTSHNGTNFDFATIKYSDVGTPLWTNRYNGPGNGDDFMRAKAVVDASGNFYVAGRSTGTNGIFQVVTIAYSGAGVPLWTNYYYVAGNYGNTATAVAVDNSSNLFVTGYSQGSGPFDPFDFATIKYSSAGTPLWTNRYNGGGDDEAMAVAADTNGNAYVLGYSVSQQTNYFYATIKYSGAGVPLWTNHLKSPGNGFGLATAMAVDRGSGNIYVTGYMPVTVNGNNAYTTAAYSSAGTPLWTNYLNRVTDGGGQANAIAVGASGNVYVAGYSTGITGQGDYATVAYSSAGVALWTNIYNGPGNAFDGGRAIAVSGDDVFVTGASDGGSSSTDYATIKYASGGAIPFSFQNTGGSTGFSNGLFGFKLSGPAGSNVVIQASTNLQSWQSLQTNNFGAGTLNFSDPQSPTNNRRYYRAILLP